MATNKWFEFRVPGKIIWDQNERNKLAFQNSTGAAVARLFILEDNGKERGVVVVFNKENKNPDGSTKESRWGLPTETVDRGDTPLATAQDTGWREINLPGKTVEVAKEPILANITVNQKGQQLLHLLFKAEFQPYTDIPREINDEDGEVTKAIILDPTSIITSDNEPPYFLLNGQKEKIYPAHVGYIAWGYNFIARAFH